MTRGTRIFGLDGKVAAIVGAASGIGEAVALGCARHGATVHCLDVNADGAARVAQAATVDGPSAHAAGLDIRDADAVDAALEAIVGSSGRLDIAVCTPSINVRKRLLDYTSADFDAVVTLNLKGSFNVLRAAARHMTAQGAGSIILFSSIRSQVVEPGQSVYAATKAGIVQLARTGRRRARRIGDSRQRGGAWRRRDPADRADQEEPRLVRRLREQERPRPMGLTSGDGRPGALPGLGRRELRHGHGVVRRRRLDGGRRTLSAARDLNTGLSTLGSRLCYASRHDESRDDERRPGVGS